MPGFRKWLVVATVIVVCCPTPSRAYVDLAPTLARLVRESQAIAVVEVDRLSVEKGIIILKKVRDLKGTLPAESIKHRVMGTTDSVIDRAILEWAEPGARCVLFVSGRTTLACIGRGWYQLAEVEGYWQISVGRPNLPLTYYGSVSRLCEAIPKMTAGKTAIITTLPHGADQQGGASFDLALNRANLPGLVKVQRIRADLNMPPMVMAVSANSAYLIGMGAAGEDDIPELRKDLKSADATVRGRAPPTWAHLVPGRRTRPAI